ncbi:MAG: sigma-70 family RNA polymerase sigma factor [Micromonosporaceae bacterium]
MDEAVTDAAIVARLRDGDPTGLSQLYDRYAARLYAFCVTVLRDRGTAQDVVQDVLIIAYQRVGQLRDPQRLRSWLYAVARNECLRQLRSARPAVELEAAGDVAAELPDPAVGVHSRELQRLVWRAAEGLNPRERAAIELSVRHGLSGRELADALGVTVNHAQTLLARAREQLERGLSALLIGGAPRGDCAELAAIVAGWDGRLTVLMRKRISRHVEACAACTARKRHEVSATALLAATPLPVLPLLPAELGRTFEEHAATPDPALVRRAGPYDRSGFPTDRRRRRAWYAAAGIVLVLLLGTGAVGRWWTPDVPLLAGGPANSAPAAPGTGSPVPRVRGSETPSPTVSAAPGKSASPGGPAPVTGGPTTSGPTQPGATTKPPPAPGTVSFGDNPVALGPLYEKTTTVTASGGPVTWTAAPGPGWESWLSISPSSRTLAAGESVTVTITLTRHNKDPGNGTIVFTVKGGGTKTLNVTWSKPIG